jgi:hypothetical protein
LAADTGEPSIPAREAIFAEAGPICYCSDCDRAGDDAVAIRLCFGATIWPVSFSDVILQEKRCRWLS